MRRWLVVCFVRARRWSGCELGQGARVFMLLPQIPEVYCGWQSFTTLSSVVKMSDPLAPTPVRVWTPEGASKGGSIRPNNVRGRTQGPNTE
eukprot:277532-Rhodomonas_salina.1